MRPSFRPGTVFQLAKDPVSLPASLKLRNLEWGILFAVTGEHTVAQIGDYFGLRDDERDLAFARLVETGLVSEREVNYAEYLRAAATLHDDEPKSLGRFLRGGIVFTPPPAKLVSRPVAAPPPAELADDASITRAIPTGLPSVPFEPLVGPAPPAVPAASGGKPRLSLKALMQTILGRAADLEAGQLDVYRVFIRVDTRLLRQSGITTLRFEEDRLISDPALQQAIATSVEKTLGWSCPREVFV